MGTLVFELPTDLPVEDLASLRHAYVVGGQDAMPYLTRTHVTPETLTLARDLEDSGSLVVPWTVPNAGQFLASTATLIERKFPYQLPLELARGKVNQVRGQASDWLMGPLQLPMHVSKLIRNATLAFSKAVTMTPLEQSRVQAQTALNLAYQAAEALMQVYTNQVFQMRHQRQPRFDTTLGCRLGRTIPVSPLAEELKSTLNSVCIPLLWSDVEPTESSYNWEPFDALLDWAQAEGFHVSAGPLIDFSVRGLPEWLWLWQRDLSSIASFLCDYVETTVKRYRDRIRTWQLTAASNSSNVMALTEDELLGLTVRLVEAARQVDPGLDVSVGIAQPWGEYLAVEDRSNSPFVFADTLIRAGVHITALDIELVMGIWPRGSYCRDRMEVSRLLDLYSVLGVPLNLTVGYPAHHESDANADSEMNIGAGEWQDGFTPEVQADWATDFVSLALCKSCVRGVQWAHLLDADPHQFPSAGLVDAQSVTRPALERLRELRQKHLR
jgi:hypothetical protein